MAIHAETGVLTTANTSIPNGGTSGAFETLVTGSAAGKIIDEITISATNTTTAGMIRMYVWDGAAAALHSQIPVSAITPAANTPTWNTVIRPLNLKLHTNQEIRFTTQNSETFHLTASVTEL